MVLSLRRRHPAGVWLLPHHRHRIDDVRVVEKNVALPPAEDQQARANDRARVAAPRFRLLTTTPLSLRTSLRGLQQVPHEVLALVAHVQHPEVVVVLAAWVRMRARLTLSRARERILNLRTRTSWSRSQRTSDPRAA